MFGSKPIPLDAVVETDAYKEADSGLVVPIGVAQEGLYAEQIARWKEGAIAGNESSRSLTKAERQALKKERKKNRYLEKELNRKEKALAETAALLVLKKKPRHSGGARGRMISQAARQSAIEVVHEAVKAGARREMVNDHLNRAIPGSPYWSHPGIGLIEPRQDRPNRAT